MVVRRNSFYNDPSIGQGFDNIAAMFKPPTGQEAYAWARAGASRDETARTATALANINSGRANVGDYAAAGISNPAQNHAVAEMYRRSITPGARPADLDASAYAVNGNANNTFEGQGRSLANDLEKNRLTQATNVRIEGMKPVAQNAVRFLPPSVMPVLGYDQPAAAPASPWEGAPAVPNVAPAGGDSVSAMFAATPPSAPAPMAAGPIMQRGNVNLKPGERVVQPNGAVLNGQDKPLSLDEVKAIESQDLRKRGVLDDQTMAAIIFGNTPLQNVETPEGTRVATSFGSVGQEPAPDASKTSELAKLQNERDEIASSNSKDPRIAEYNQRIQALGRGQHQDEYSKNIDKNLAEFNESIFKNAQSAQGNLATVNRLGEMLKEVGNDQGKWASLRTEVRRGLNALGIAAGDTSPAEVAKALANKFALQLRDPSSGAGMPGALSDSDREFLRSMVANIDNSPKANEAIIDIYRQLNQRTIDLEVLRRNYVEQNGRLDEKFRTKVSEYAMQNPIFASASQAKASSASAPVRVNTPDEAKRLPPGTSILMPDGTLGLVR